MAPPDERQDGPPAGGAAGGDPLVGALVAGKYRVKSWVARGGMGRIYRCEQEPLGRAVALKVLTPPQGDRDPTLEKRFLLEAATYARLTHPNTVTVHDYGALRVEGGRVGTEDTFFIVLEWVNGRTLAHAIKNDPPFSAARTLRIAREICRSLREAHALGIVHRDLKPSNVMLVQRDEGESVKVLDFGVAKVVAEGHEGVTTHAAFLGSPRYSAPEQIKQEDIDHRVDIYALGVVMYEMLAGNTPFGGGEAMRTMYAHLNQAVPPIKERSGRDVPPEVEDLVRRCLEKDPAQRWPDVDMLIDAIRDVAVDIGAGEEVAPDTWSGSGSKRGYAMDPPASPPSTPTLPAPPVDPEPSMASTTRAGGVGVVAGVVAAAVLAGIVVLGIVGAFVWKLGTAPNIEHVERPDARPVATDAAPPHEAVWVVESVPDGAEVWSGDQKLGNAPLSVPIGKGFEVLTLKMAGYRDGAVRRSEDLGNQTSLVELQPVPPPEPPTKPVTKGASAPKKPRGGDDILLQR